MKKNNNSSWNNSNLDDHGVNISNCESLGNITLHNQPKNYVLKSTLCNNENGDSNISSNINTSVQMNGNNDIENIFA